MKKILALTLTAAMALTSLTACGGSSSSAPAGTTAAAASEAAAPAASGKAEYTWKMALNSSEGDNAYDMGAAFAQKIEEITDGRVHVDLYGGAALGSTAEVLEGMEFGVADCMVEGVNTLQPWSDFSNVDWLPYLYSSYEHWRKVWDSDIGDRIKDKVCEESGFKLYGACFRNPRVVTATYEMKDIEDFKGFKIRTPNIENALKTWEWIGATPTPMAMNEVYTALQQKTVDGQENPLPDSKNYAFDEVCKYWIKTNHVYGANVLIFSNKYIETLPEDIQQAIEEAADYASETVSEKHIQLAVEKEQELKDEGVNVIEVDWQKFADFYDGYVEKTFPYLVDIANEIRAMDE